MRQSLMCLRSSATTTTTTTLALARLAIRNSAGVAPIAHPARRHFHQHRTISTTTTTIAITALVVRSHFSTGGLHSITTVKNMHTQSSSFQSPCSPSPANHHVPTQSKPQPPSTSNTTKQQQQQQQQQQETIPNTSIPILRTLPAMRAWRLSQQQQGQRIVGFVPTMGALHTGHLSLARLAARDTDAVVLSIYVNPAQFGLRDDLASYPTSWDEDLEKIVALDRELADAAAGPQARESGGGQDGKAGGNRGGRIAAIFAPSTRDMYPSGFPGQEPDSDGSFVTITPAGGAVLEGAARPTFFRGVATVCMKLFHVVQPDRVYFGQKDVQQTVVIRTMVRDFLMPIVVVVGPTMREEPDGLALSSRNVYLGPRRRKVVGVLYRALRAAEKAYVEGGVVAAAEVLSAARKVTDAVMQEQARLQPSERVKFEVDYLSLADPNTMMELEQVDPTKGAILSGTIRVFPVEEANEGEDLGHSNGPMVRLLDNIILPPITTA